MPKDRHQHRRQGFSAPPKIKPYYYITIHTIENRPRLNSLYAGRCVIKALKSNRHCAFTIAFAVLPNCLHWLMLPRGKNTVPQTVARVKSQSAMHYQELAGSENALWHRAWDERAIREDDNIRDIALHIITSPNRAGLTTHVGDYPHWDAAFMGETQAGEIWQSLLKD